MEKIKLSQKKKQKEIKLPADTDRFNKIIYKGFFLFKFKPILMSIIYIIPTPIGNLGDITLNLEKLKTS